MIELETVICLTDFTATLLQLTDMIHVYCVLIYCYYFNVNLNIVTYIKGPFRFRSIYFRGFVDIDVSEI